MKQKSWSSNSHLSYKKNNFDFLKPEIQIYPNPASNKVFINLQKFTSEQPVVSIYNVQGKEVHSSSNNLFANVLELDVSGLNRGIYLLQVRSNDDIFTEKLIVK